MAFVAAFGGWRSRPAPGARVSARRHSTAGTTAHARVNQRASPPRHGKPVAAFRQERERRRLFSGGGRGGGGGRSGGGGSSGGGGDKREPGGPDGDDDALRGPMPIWCCGAVAYEVSGASKRNYSIDESDGSVVVLRENVRAQRGRLFEEVRLFFLPEGFPESVGPSYAAYSVWRGLQNIISAMTAVLSTQALLSAVGIGPGASQSIAAATSWVLKDGFGSLGKMVTARMGHSFDSESKMYRLASDILFDLGISLELVTPLFPAQFLVLAAMGNFVKSVSVTMGMACRNSVLATFVLRENLGEISSKNDAQNTVANLTGLGLGIATARVLPQSAAVRLAVFWSLTSVYSLLNYKSMKAVTLRTLNRQRAAIAIDSFLRGEPLPSPDFVNKHERIIPFLPKRFAEPQLRLGAPLSTLEGGLKPAVNAASSRGDRYIMDIGPRSVDVVLHRDAKAQDMLEAFLAYCHLRRALQAQLSDGRCAGVSMRREAACNCVPKMRRIWAEIDPASRYHQLGKSREFAKKNVKKLSSELQAAGFSMSTLLFAPERLRAVF